MGKFTFTLIGYVDQSYMEKDVREVIKKVKEGEIEVDMKNVSFIISSALTQIVKLYKHCKKNKMGFRVINANGCLNTFEILNLTKLFTVTP